MSMTHRHLFAGLLGLCALVSCADDHAYDTYPYGHYAGHAPRPTYGPGPAPTPYGNPNPYGTAPGGANTANPYGTAPYGTQPGNPYAQGATANPDGSSSPSPTPLPAPAPTPADDYPTATRVPENPDWVISPFDPNRRISIEGIPSGELRRDPENKKIFRVP